MWMTVCFWPPGATFVACECECVYVQCPLDLKLQQDTESVFGDYILVRGEGCWNPVYLVQPGYGSRWDL